MARSAQVLMLDLAARLAACGCAVQDTGLNRLDKMYSHLLALHQGQLHAGYVPAKLSCLHGNGVGTDQAYHYDVDDLQAATAPAPTATTGTRGDGTVGLESLEVRYG
jgi:hypothetical protein